MSDRTIRDQLLKAGAKNLRQFGYPDARPDNLLTTFLFGQFFKSMLEETLEARPALADTINPMLAEIAALKHPSEP